MAADPTEGVPKPPSSAAALEPEKKKQPELTLAFHELFSFVDLFDWLLMASGSFGAVIHGFAMPVFFLLFGDLVWEKPDGS